MAKFRFVARDREGHLIEGIIRSKTEELAVVELKETGYHLEDITIRKESSRFLGDLESLEIVPALRELAREFQALFQKTDSKMLSLFLRQMFVLTNAGIPLVKALGTLDGGGWPPSLSVALRQVERGINSGMSLHRMMERFPSVFPRTLASIIGVGEASGRLARAFERASLLAEQEAKIELRISSALVYPVTLVATAFLIMAVIMLFLLPRLSDMLLSFNITTFWGVHLILKVAKFIGEPIVIISIIEILGALGLLAFLLLKTPAGRNTLDSLLLRIPIVKKFLLRVGMSRLAYNLWLLTESGVSLLEALKILPGAVGNESLALTINHAMEGVIEGLPLSDALQEDRRFPRVFIQMLRAGEESGNLSESLLYLCRYYDLEIEIGVDSFLAIFEPLMVAFMGLFVGGLLLLFLPLLYQLTMHMGG
ncbi:MAG: type II secretion system F family protein [Candidatus Eremiobacteraeota bacterium]|nr:type II secretion system F family protein [Candidatus Eremiobacteraeota bacterium]